MRDDQPYLFYQFILVTLTKTWSSTVVSTSHRAIAWFAMTYAAFIFYSWRAKPSIAPHNLTLALWNMISKHKYKDIANEQCDRGIPGYKCRWIVHKSKPYRPRHSPETRKCPPFRVLRMSNDNERILK